MTVRVHKLKRRNKASLIPPPGPCVRTSMHRTALLCHVLPGDVKQRIDNPTLTQGCNCDHEPCLYLHR